MERWVNRVALVTGASAGIGAAICCVLVKHGMKVVGCARNVDKIEDLANDPEIKASSGSLDSIKCDLSKESDILEMFSFIRKKYGRIDVCINNAGFSTVCPLLSGSTEDWKSMFDVNVLALCICTREAIQLMRESNVDDGQIIHISSICGHVVLDIDLSFYTGTKFMVRALTEGLRQELRKTKTHIRVASISPGVVETEFVARMCGDEEKAKAFYASVKALKSEDIASAVVTILQTPPHVDINDIIMTQVKREG